MSPSNAVPLFPAVNGLCLLAHRMRHIAVR
nr:MAG TPA: hypothetical protein [Herelleviridae sp.]